MAKIKTPLAALGSQTAPTTIPVTLPSADSKTFVDYLPMSFADLDDLSGVAMANGVDAIRHSVAGSLLNTGLLPPIPTTSDLTTTPTGARATFTIALNTGSFTNNDTFGIYYDYSPIGYIKITNDLSSATSGYHWVELQGTDAATMDVIEDVINGVSSTKWTNLDTRIGFDALEVSANTGTAITFRVKEYGTDGNKYLTSDITWTDTNITPTSGTSFSGGTDGSGTAPGAGEYRYLYTYIRTTDSAESGPSSTSSVSQGTAQNVDIEAAVDGNDPDYDFNRWYRTLTQGVEFYRGGDFTGATDTDNVSDENMVLYGAIPYDASAHRTYLGGPVPRYRVLASWKGRLWGGGAVLSATYTRGDCAVVGVTTTPSATVTMQNGAVVTEQMIGRSFRVTNNSDAEYYLIVNVSESGQSLTLNRPYQGASKDPAEYEIIDSRDATAIACSEPGLPNQWPEDNELTGITSDDPRGVTGMIPHGDSLFIFCVDGIWRLTGDDILSWQLTKVVDGVGCVAPETLRGLPGGMAWLGRDGVYAWSGGGQPERISSPPVVEDRVSGIDGTLDRINWPHVHLAHATYDRDDRTFRIFVPLDDAVAPDHAIVLDMSTRGTFSLDRVPGITASASILDGSGDPLALQGDRSGYLYQYGTSAGAAGTYQVSSSKEQDTLAVPTKGNLSGDFTATNPRTKFRIQKRGIFHSASLGALVGGDGAFGVEPVATLTSATARLLTVSGASWTSSAFKGLPAWVVDKSAGTATRVKIADNTGTALTLEEDMDTAPVAGDQVVIGGIYMDLETGRWDLGETRRSKKWKDLWVTHSPGAAAILGFELDIQSRNEDGV